MTPDYIYMPDWFWKLLGQTSVPSEGEEFMYKDSSFIIRDGIPRSIELNSDSQQQTSNTFGYKWKQRNTFESKQFRKAMRKWATDRYGPVDNWVSDSNKPVVLDAGCGAAYTAVEYFGPVLDKIRYIGADISSAVDIARERISENGIRAGFIQCDLARLPIKPESIDIIFSEGVLHHTDSTESAIKSLVPLLRQNGLFLFYVYKKKGPVREYTDDYIRGLIQEISPDKAWEAVMPLTKLGKTLGDLDIEIDVEEPIDLLQIPAGKINLQRFFYWHIFKVFYRSDYSLEEMNHINFDWYAPKNAHRQTPEQVRNWCKDAGLVIDHEKIEDAGITIVAHKS